MHVFCPCVTRCRYVLLLPGSPACSAARCWQRVTGRRGALCRLWVWMRYFHKHMQWRSWGQRFFSFSSIFPTEARIILFVSAAIFIHHPWSRTPACGTRGRSIGTACGIPEEMGRSIHESVSGVFTPVHQFLTSVQYILWTCARSHLNMIRRSLISKHDNFCKLHKQTGRLKIST